MRNYFRNLKTQILVKFLRKFRKQLRFDWTRKDFGRRIVVEASIFGYTLGRVEAELDGQPFSDRFDYTQDRF